MNKLSLLISSLLIVPAVTLADEVPQQFYESIVSNDILPLLKTFSYPTYGGFTVSVSTDGVITTFQSPAGYDHIGTGFIGEGYLVCATLNTVENGYFEHGESESGFGGPIFSTTAASATTERTTFDGFLKVKTQFTFSGPNRELYVTMTLTNLLNVPLQNVKLARLADFDVDTGGINGWAGYSNYFGNTADSAFAWNVPADAPLGKTAHKMILRHITSTPTTIPHVAQVRTAYNDNSCNPPLTITPPYDSTKGDHSVAMQYNIGTLAAKKAVIVKLAYSRD
jgi:hypothetical protein